MFTALVLFAATQGERLHSIDRTFIFKLCLDIAVDGNGCCEHTDRDAISDF